VVTDDRGGGAGAGRCGSGEARSTGAMAPPPQQRTGVAGTHREIDHAVWAEGQALVRDHAGQSASAMLRDSQRGLGLAVIQLKCEAKIHGLTG
jgi:hypothetical protein